MTPLTRYTHSDQLCAAWDDGEISEEEYDAEMYRLGFTDKPVPVPDNALTQEPKGKESDA